MAPQVLTCPQQSTCVAEDMRTRQCVCLILTFDK